MKVNLLEVLTKEDKKRIEEYIHLYGARHNFIGVDNWLKDWAANNFRMYRLLGNQLIHKIPFTYEKTEKEYRCQIANLRDFIPYGQFYSLCDLELLRDYPDVHEFIKDCLSSNSLMNDKISTNLKIKLPGKKKTFQVQVGSKPLRSLAKFLHYCEDCGSVTFKADVQKLITEVDELLLKYSMIYNDKTIHGNLVLSIHPLDFMTMSDNASRWQSCMSWVHEGCYRVGTVEMMNSNNVLCCYLENPNTPFTFGTTEKFEWNNKRWRQLVYFTKDIVVTGKPYPYENEDLSKKLLEVIRKLAKENLNWTYSFGPELYQDMIHINSLNAVENIQFFIRHKRTRKHNIIFHTKGMYNDMLNDSNMNYWCIRNKVDHNKVISYSGKAPCLCCGGTALREQSDNYGDYNDRYFNTNELICEDCLEDTRCFICGETSAIIPRKIVYGGDGDGDKVAEIKICDSCETNFIYKCPCCGKTFFASELYDSYCKTGFEELGGDHFAAYIKVVPDEDIKPTDFANSQYYNIVQGDFGLVKEKTAIPVFMCNDCLEKDNRFEYKQVKVPTGWMGYNRDIYISKEVQNLEDWVEYWAPLHTDLAEGEILTC